MPHKNPIKKNKTQKLPLHEVPQSEIKTLSTENPAQQDKAPLLTKSNVVRQSSKNLIKKPHITEKTNLLKGKNQYVFEIVRNANKSEVKKIIEKTHKVNVISVNTVRIGKLKKAIISLKEGQTINEKI